MTDFTVRATGEKKIRTSIAMGNGFQLAIDTTLVSPCKMPNERKVYNECQSRSAKT